MKFFALHNGKPTTVVPAANRGFAYGDGLFETIKVIGGRAQFLDEHLQRLKRDCARLDIVVDNDVLEQEIAWFLARQETGVLKIIVTRTSLLRGYAAPLHAPAERVLQFHSQKFIDDERATAGVAIRLCRQRLSEQPTLAGMKHLNRLEQVLARAEWSDSNIVEGLMLDVRGRLVEGTMTNVFLVCDGLVTTPRLHRSGVAGVIREIILNRLSVRCAPVISRDLTLEDLYGADEVFLTNSVLGILPVRKIECIQKAVGEVTAAFQTALANLIAEQNSL